MVDLLLVSGGIRIGDSLDSSKTHVSSIRGSPLISEFLSLLIVVGGGHVGLVLEVVLVEESWLIVQVGV